MDRLTGLGWALQLCGAEPVTWPAAVRKAEALGRREVAGRRDWRLPTINELESLVDAGRCAPALVAGHSLTAVPVDLSCWSSTTSGYDPAWAMALYAAEGAVGVGQKRGAHHHAWAVCGRGDPPGGGRAYS